ncbi:hypothetical protein HanHA300_Chr04g0129891 [Helianthus annuus]|nr:hypothetical protein HanHA300_Chr04g0129891 [Helianthus annuus]KAJ0596454.1 hypothetical protein HanHA89_Chr04g0142941 [Helianthus annuus]KAJ0757113.1 hypothetical protein HanLR1_Chr04g0134851 [Helianthus annuus]
MGLGNGSKPDKLGKLLLQKQPSGFKDNKGDDFQIDGKRDTILLLQLASILRYFLIFNL